MGPHLEFHDIVRRHLMHDTGAQYIDHLSDRLAPGYGPSQDHASIFGKNELYLGVAGVWHASRMGIRGLCHTGDDLGPDLICHPFGEARDTEGPFIDDR